MTRGTAGTRRAIFTYQPIAGWIESGPRQANPKQANPTA